MAGRDPGPGASAKASPEGSSEAASKPGLPGPVPLVLSAKSEEALRDSASRLAAHIEEHPDLDPADLAFSLATTRAQLEMRAVVVGEGREELLAGLSALAKGEPAANAHTAKASAGRLACLFTGQGSQRPGMGRGLHQTYPAYAQALEEACEAIAPHLDRSLKELILSEPGSEEAELLDHTTYAQPALFATELAIYRLLESLGLKADLLSGHSVGEITAAQISGVFSLADAAKLICARGKLMGELPAGGAMLAIQATEEEALASIEGKEALLSLAAVNSPNATVVSGDQKEIEEIEAHFQGKGRKTKRLSVSHAFHSPLIEPMLERFGEVVSSLDLCEPKLPVISNLSGEQLGAEQATDPAYWVAHAREPVRFADAVSTLKDRGATTFLEIGPEAVLTAMAAATLAEEEGIALIATLREGREEARAIALALGSAHASGAEVDWDAFFQGTGASAVPLPTYPFQRKRYWLSAANGAGDPGAMGQAAAEHPLLGATIEDPEGGIAMTGRISLQSHPWLADHAVGGVALLPGTALVELALRAGQEGGCELLEELTLQAPLLIPEQGGVALRVSLSPEGEQAGREVSIHSRLEGGAEQEPGEWALHAEGLLLEGAPDPLEPLGAWPPEGAEPLELDSLYERLAEAGLEYGPAFQGLTAAWRDGDDVYAEVSLAEEQVGEASRFGVHPALLDSAFHATLDIALAQSEGKAMLPFAWQGVSLLGSPGAALRVKLGLGERQIGFLAFSSDGEPLLSVASVSARELDPARLRQADRAKDLFVIEWSPLPAGEQAPEPEQAPSRLITPAELGFESCADSAEEALAATRAALALLQARLAEEEHAEERLVLLTEGAVATSEQESPDLTGASLWGLWRSARSEHPDRFALIDSDGSEASAEALESALALGADEPELALREGALLVPRLAPMRQAQEEPTAPAIDPGSTVLITGGLSGIGALVARHLASHHGQGHLLLAGRRGMQSEGAAELVKELEAAGATVTVGACDVSDRSQLQALFDSVDPEHPLGAIVHSAGVLDDGTIESLDAERLQRVFEPKASGAWHLHELSREAGISRFIAFSSIAGALGGAGQGNYAAANAFLDALAQRRRAEGLPAASIAWGRLQSGMGAALGEADLARMERLGIGALSDSEVAELFDLALGGERAHLLPVRINRAALRAHAAQGVLPSILSGLVRTPARRKGRAGSLAKRLAAAPEADHQALVLNLVLSHTAAILGHASGAEVDPERAFRELGFDSLAAVELRNGLSSATGMRIAPTIVFDYPSAAELAGYLLAEAQGGKSAGAQVGKAASLAAAEESEAIARIDAMELEDLVARTLDGQSTDAEEAE